MSEEAKTVVKGLSFMGVVHDSNAVQVDVKNGKIIRIRPLQFDWKYKPEQFNPWKVEGRDGSTFEPTMHTLIPPLTLAYKNRVYSPNRILYPLKRVDWDPNGERNPQNRGNSKYQRISWDEATELIAGEIRRIHKEYGPTAILTQMDGHGESKVIHTAHGCGRRLLSLMGGSTLQSRNPDSWEGWYWGAKHVWGGEPVGKQGKAANLVPDIAEHTDMLLFWGCDPETTPWGWNGQIVSRLCYWFTELGIKQIYICPDVNYGTAVHADKWIPIRPNTDAALQLAIAYIWITEGTYDKEYVATHTVGFDKFEEYVLGKEDGIPKTPKWAEEKTAIPSRIIKALAREWASKRTSTVHSNGGPYIRGPYSTEPARLEVILLGMQGLGKSGYNQLSVHEWGLFGKPDGSFEIGDDTNPMPGPIVWPEVSAANILFRDMRSIIRGPIIPKLLVPDAILNPPISWYGTTSSRDPVEDQFVKYTYPAEGCSEIHMVWTDSPSWMTCWNDSNSLAKALRHPKIEFTLAQHPWLENDCLFADIILPSCTKFEADDIGIDTFAGEYKSIFLDGKCIEPRGESKSEYEIVCAIAEKLGLLEQYTGGESVEDKIRKGFETSGVQDMVTWEEFSEKGYYVIPTDPDWKKKDAGMIKFYEDPDNNPLTTPSGKLEFYSQRLAEKFPGDTERPPVPHWIEKGESHDERVTSSERAKKYPLLMVSNHPRWRVHSQNDDMQWLREIETCKIVGPDGYAYQPMWINPIDAEKRGIEHRDIVNVYNERGGVLAGAYVTERIMPGAVYVDHGARYDPIVPGELDRGGAINTITPHKTLSKNATGMAVSGFLVEVEPVNLDELRKKYAEAFKRPYRVASGLRRERVLEKGVN